MFKFAVVIFALIACAFAKPGLLTAAPLAYTAPAPIVTATSSQYIARNHNGIATAPVIAPVAAPIFTKTVAPVAASLAYTAPLTYSASLPLSYAAAPVLL